LIVVEPWQLYCATSPSGKRYFGITSVGLALREKRHRDTGAKYQTIFHKALKKYGKAMVFETWVVGERDYIHELEIKAIAQYQTTDRRFGYNQCLGGNLSPMLVPEIRALAGAANRGRKLTPEHIEKATRHTQTQEFKEASSARLKEQRAEHEEARLEGIRRSSADPEVKAARQKRGAERFAILNADPEFQAADLARKLARNNDPEFQKLATAGLREAWANPEFRERESKKMKDIWADPAYRAKMSAERSARFKKMWADYYADPINNPCPKPKRKPK
jgi:hypothetical protein